MRHLLLAVTMLAAPLVGSAQIIAGSVDPGMSRTQVIERLGAPASERSINGFTYLLYPNGCERTCGMSDVVTLEGDSVIDAIFRAAERRYTGESSSPTQGYSTRSRGALAVSSEGPDRASRRRAAAAQAASFALPTEWLAGGGATATPTPAVPPASVDSIVLDISALPPKSPAKPGGQSILPAEWLSGAPPSSGATPPAATPDAPAPPPPAPAVTPSLLPPEWLGQAPPPAAQPAAQAPLPAPAPKRQSLLPAEWLGETSGGAAPKPPARADTATKRSLLPAEWLNSATPPGGTPARPDSTRPPGANPFVVSPPVAPPPAATPPPEA